MGCDQSRQKDVEESRTRVGGTSPKDAAGDGPRGPSAAQPIGVPGSTYGSSDDPMLATSYTDQRMNDEDFFRSIIAKTEGNLISTADICDGLASREYGERTLMYNTMVIGQGKLPSSNQSRLPKTHPDDDVFEILDAAAGATATEKQQLDTLCEQVQRGLASLKVQEIPGGIVAQLPEITA